MIMPSKSVIECYYSLAMDNGDNSNLDNRICSLTEGCNAVTTISVTQCAKDCVCNNIICAKGQYVVLLGGTPIACVASYDDVIGVINEHSFLANKETCIIFTGMETNNFSEERIQSLIEEINPQLEVAFVDGKQRVYNLIIGLV